MKTNLLNVAVASSIVAFALFSCANPNTKDIDGEDFRNDSTELVKTNSGSITVRGDSLVDYPTYISVIDARYIQNAEALKAMKKNLKSEVNAVQMEYDKDLYELNKRNLAIKTKVNDHVIQGSKSWDVFKKSTSDEMDQLEKSIQALAEKVS